MNTLSSIVRDNRFRPEDVSKFESKLFFEGTRARPYLERFFTLLTLATIIATAGVLADSTATVIGAMIVAPLMIPIMATAAALIMGNIPRALNRLTLVAVGVAVVILLSWLFGVFYTGAIVFTENSQIVARTSPRLIDLVAALASGAAGAFCLSRDDIADSLPGVAISISLVPPLCVTGISLSAGEWNAAAESFLLFTTNFLAILLAGGSVLAILGLNSAAMNQVRGTGRRTAFTMIILAVVLVAIPLFLTGQRVSRETYTEVKTQQVASDWVAGTGYTVRQVRSVKNNVYVGIIGHGEPPVFDDLVAAIEASVGRPLTVQMEMIPSEVRTNALE
ncbi:MAG: DUF389 domain-containing protein [Anaerolineae bacterium]|nr:DUF389 domain-containing protein [Anaerolineae bacterium]MCO5189197.1 DUF389 domain-containing protein [Anaerolineae bacterium]